MHIKDAIVCAALDDGQSMICELCSIYAGKID